MWSKRGQGVLEEPLFWLFWVPLIGIILIGLVIIPGKVFDTAAQVQPLDAGITNERLIQKVTAFSPILGVEHNTLTDTFYKDAELLLSQKKYAYKISIPDDSYTGNEEFYEDAVPLAPVKYDKFTINTIMNGPQGPTYVTTNQVFPKRYERFQ